MRKVLLRLVAPIRILRLFDCCARG